MEISKDLKETMEECLELHKEMHHPSWIEEILGIVLESIQLEVNRADSQGYIRGFSTAQKFLVLP